MLYRNTKDGTFGHQFSTIRKMFSNISIPIDKPYGDFEPYTSTMQPIPAWNQQVIEVAPLDGFQQWKLIDITPELYAERTAAQSERIRSDRNELLRASDWTQLADVPHNAETKAAWVVYRTALRNLTTQPGFPWEVEWPVEPTEGTV